MKKEYGKVPFVCVYFVTESGELVEEKGYAKLAEFRGKHIGFAQCGILNCRSFILAHYGLSHWH